LFSFFRVLDFEGKYKFETIYTDSTFSSRSYSSQISIVKSLVDETLLEKFYEWMNLPYLYKYRGSLKTAVGNIQEKVLDAGFHPISKSAPGTLDRQVSTHPDVLR